jgi:hypothetical protein
MADLIATNAEYARRGINKILSIEGKKLEDYASKMGFKVINSTESFIRIKQEAGLGLLQQVNEGDEHPEATFATPYGADYYWNIYKLKYAQTREKMKSDQYGRQTAAAIGKKLANSVQQTKNTLSAAVFVNGFSGGPTGPDGVSLFNASHPLATGTSSNVLASDISASELALAIQSLMSQRDHKGQPVICAGPYTLVVPAGNFVAAHVLKDSMLLPGSTNNDVNFQGQQLSGVVYNPYLTDSDSWFLIDKNMAEGLHELQFAGGTEIETDENKDRGYVYFMAADRRSYGFHDWRGLLASPGA